MYDLNYHVFKNNLIKITSESQSQIRNTRWINGVIRIHGQSKKVSIIQCLFNNEDFKIFRNVLNVFEFFQFFPFNWVKMYIRLQNKSLKLKKSKVSFKCLIKRGFNFSQKPIWKGLLTKFIGVCKRVILFSGKSSWLFNLWMKTYFNFFFHWNEFLLKTWFNEISTHDSYYLFIFYKRWALEMFYGSSSGLFFFSIKLKEFSKTNRLVKSCGHSFWSRKVQLLLEL